MTASTEYIRKILAAQIYDVALKTPLDSASILSARFNNTILIKREDLQPVYSFKIRGAMNKLSQLSESEAAKGVIGASAGNHAQGLALGAKKLGIKATIVMPQTTPNIKVAAVRSYGAQVVLKGDTFDEAFQYSQELVKEKGFTYIHPYDDPDVIAGQGTVGVEILQQYSKTIDAIFVPVGGGGLIAGVAQFIKYLKPEIRVIGVESEESACLKAAFRDGKRTTLPQVGIFADGVAVAQIGKNTWEACREVVDEVIAVSNDEICAAIMDIFDDTRSICEPAGALGIAGLKRYIEREGAQGQTLIAINSGANINFDRLRYIAERTEIGEKREAVFAVTIPEVPGSFLKFCRAIGRRNITEFNYRYDDKQTARLYVGVSVNPKVEESQVLMKDLQSQGYSVVDLTDNELAKLHLRHMISGQPDLDSSPHSREFLYRFEFPERPGALQNFLSVLGHEWNITLFHYRNHGAASGRVLVGFQSSEGDLSKIEACLYEAGYPYWNETDNEAYQLFFGRVKI